MCELYMSSAQTHCSTLMSSTPTIGSQLPPLVRLYGSPSGTSITLYWGIPLVTRYLDLLYVKYKLQCKYDIAQSLCAETERIHGHSKKPGEQNQLHQPWNDREKQRRQHGSDSSIREERTSSVNMKHWTFTMNITAPSYFKHPRTPLPKANLTKPRKLLHPELSNEI